MLEAGEKKKAGPTDITDPSSCARFRLFLFLLFRLLLDLFRFRLGGFLGLCSLCNHSRDSRFRGKADGTTKHEELYSPLQFSALLVRFIGSRGFEDSAHE